MYGIVNRAVGELVCAQFGTEVWERVKQRSGIAPDFFISNEPYDDAITYSLVAAVCAETNLSAAEVLEAFGEWWVLHTGKKRYGSLMEAGGDNLRTFLLNLPQFHNRILLIYPHLVPPEFRISDVGDHELLLHYYSGREGLEHFVLGLLYGLGKMYQTPVTVTLKQSRAEGARHAIFHVSWAS